MIFAIHDLSFTLGSLVLEGYPAFAARCLCALLLLAAGEALRRWLRGWLFPRLVEFHWPSQAVNILLGSFAAPAAWLALTTGLYLALASLPWGSVPMRPFLLKFYRFAVILLLSWGMYGASSLTELLLTSSREEIRTSSLAAQDTASNLFGGVMILIERPFQIGDWIIVGDVEGSVEDISFRSTRVRALDNSVYILTNSNVCASTINNAAQRQKRLYRFTLGVEYSATRAQLEQLMTDLRKMLSESPSVYPESVIVELSGFGASSIDLLVSAYLRTADTVVFYRMQNDLNLSIMDIVRGDGLDFAFPSTTVYLKENQ